jgi:hypothetical protein
MTMHVTRPINNTPDDCAKDKKKCEKRKIRIESNKIQVIISSSAATA